MSSRLVLSCRQNAVVWVKNDVCRQNGIMKVVVICRWQSCSLLCYSLLILTTEMLVVLDMMFIRSVLIALCGQIGHD